MCMGRTHAISGVTAWLASVPLVDQVTPLGWREVVAGAIITAGAAMVPDLDHPSSSVARSWGPLTRALARVVARVSGGHRHATHSLFFALGVGALGWWAGLAGGWWILVPVFLVGSLAIGTLSGKSKGPRNEILAAGLALAVHLGEVGTAWLGLALFIGCLAHVLGDMLTPERCPILWPSRRRYGIGLFTTNTWRERVFAGLLVVANVVLVVRLAGYGQDALSIVGVT